MNHLQKAQNYMQRAIKMKSKNPKFADRLFEEAKREMIKAK